MISAVSRASSRSSSDILTGWLIPTTVAFCYQRDKSGRNTKTPGGSQRGVGADEPDGPMLGLRPGRFSRSPLRSVRSRSRAAEPRSVVRARRYQGATTRRSTASTYGGSPRRFVRPHDRFAGPPGRDSSRRRRPSARWTAAGTPAGAGRVGPGSARSPAGVNHRGRPIPNLLVSSPSSRRRPRSTPPMRSAPKQMKRHHFRPPSTISCCPAVGRNRRPGGCPRRPRARRCQHRRRCTKPI